MKTTFKIVRLEVLNKHNAKPPTDLTVSYKGWWHLPKLQVPLALDLLHDNDHATKKNGNIALAQEFPSGGPPSFRVKGRNSKLEIRLFAGRSLRTHAKVTVGDLVAATAEGVVQVPFKENLDGKVTKAFLWVAQTAPFATPEVLPDDNDHHAQPDHHEQGMDQSQNITPEDCDAYFVRLWKTYYLWSHGR